MQKEVYFNNDNKLCITTDRGEILNDFYKILIQGEFIIQAEDVAKLLQIVNKQNVVCEEYYGLRKTWYIADRNMLTEANKSLAEEVKILNKLLDEKRDKIDSLLSSIQDFNKSRRFYERKLELKK